MSYPPMSRLSVQDDCGIMDANHLFIFCGQDVRGYAGRGLSWSVAVWQQRCGYVPHTVCAMQSRSIKVAGGNRQGTHTIGSIVYAFHIWLAHWSGTCCY